MKDSDPTAGMLRLVMGLGTSAVDRTEGSYPRIVNLDMPEKSSYSSSADKHKFSQGKAEVINMTTHQLEKLSYDMLEPVIPKYLENIDPALSADENIKRLCFTAFHSRLIQKKTRQVWISW